MCGEGSSWVSKQGPGVPLPSGGVMQTTCFPGGHTAAQSSPQGHSSEPRVRGVCWGVTHAGTADLCHSPCRRQTDVMWP